MFPMVTLSEQFKIEIAVRFELCNTRKTFSQGTLQG